MQRSIEFRVWDGLRMTSSGIMFNTSTSSLSVPNTNYVLMQFTGILDAKDKKIFEGDIHREEVEYDQGDVRNYYVCTYIKELACFSFISAEEYKCYVEYQMPFHQAFEGEKPYTLDVDEKSKYHICGNVFDNPNLLEGDDHSDLDLEE